MVERREDGGIIANHLAVSEPGSKFPLKPEEIPPAVVEEHRGNLAQLRRLPLAVPATPDLQSEEVAAAGLDPGAASLSGPPGSPWLTCRAETQMLPRKPRVSG